MKTQAGYHRGVTTRYSAMENTTQSMSLAEQLERDLFDRHGPMVGGSALLRLLGYATTVAFRQALARGTLPVPVFTIPHRRGKFALVKDIASWMATRRETATVRPTE
ncbi:hypothetical protein HNQ50_003036 [Silvimonas terrae]|uniref:Uncharacterized protein n=1 Tax=Silvimonas terrae TaxID=300266 RepID=A0A840RG34_9NEIS|nr:hypothetical protein [Silvimonas terrae]MBB5192295.1 hypothetical protein [Silvimonas terrae]